MGALKVTWGIRILRSKLGLLNPASLRCDLWRVHDSLWLDTECGVHFSGEKSITLI